MKVAINLTGKPIPFVIEKSRFILASLTGNLAFPVPVPTLIILEGLIDALSTAYDNAINKDKVKKALMRIALANLMDALRSEAAYVEVESGGDETMILSSGFDVRQPRSPIGILPGPSNLRSELGPHPGEILLLHNGVKRRLIYLVQKNDKPGDESQWKDYLYTTKIRLPIVGLVSGTSYQFRIATITVAGIGSYCDPIEVKVL